MLSEEKFDNFSLSVRDYCQIVKTKFEEKCRKKFHRKADSSAIAPTCRLKGRPGFVRTIPIYHNARAH